MALGSLQPTGVDVFDSPEYRRWLFWEHSVYFGRFLAIKTD